ncbi:nuclear transport factor 2 family protein [Microtetraspora fusca]|uniref:Nuclear transport factor 2 family protein n=1 Tax=Microtetraspora fusca TaxID=1997 RepID=A0ABW6V090_MICFU|nr:nuclear transport factor 2 family protein [Microtetraspora fusca]
MSADTGASIDTETLVRIHQLYGEQSHLIDNGRAREWAATFSADGEFHSPTYPDPVVGTARLTTFAERFFEEARSSGVTTRHVITNLFVHSADDRSAIVHAYLQIVSTPVGGEPRLVRMTTITDDLVRQDGRWLIRRRVVRRDDTP